jgi:hypothetical protein
LGYALVQQGVISDPHLLPDLLYGFLLGKRHCPSVCEPPWARTLSPGRWGTFLLKGLDEKAQAAGSLPQAPKTGAGRVAAKRQKR